MYLTLHFKTNLLNWWTPSLRDTFCNFNHYTFKGIISVFIYSNKGFYKKNCGHKQSKMAIFGWSFYLPNWGRGYQGAVHIFVIQVEGRGVKQNPDTLWGGWRYYQSWSMTMAGRGWGLKQLNIMAKFKQGTHKKGRFQSKHQILPPPLWNHVQKFIDSLIHCIIFVGGWGASQIMRGGGWMSRGGH